MAACIHYAATLIPLEEIYTIPRPAVEEEDPYASKKTWRGERPAVKENTETWTAGGIMEGRALERGFCEFFSKAVEFTSTAAQSGSDGERWTSRWQSRRKRK
jgi:hypothetical protein